MEYNFTKAPTANQNNNIKCKRTITQKFAIKIKKTEYKEFIICEIHKIPIIFRQIKYIETK